MKAARPDRMRWRAEAARAEAEAARAEVEAARAATAEAHLELEAAHAATAEARAEAKAAKVSAAQHLHGHGLSSLECGDGMSGMAPPEQLSPGSLLNQLEPTYEAAPPHYSRSSLEGTPTPGPAPSATAPAGASAYSIHSLQKLYGAPFPSSYTSPTRAAVDAALEPPAPLSADQQAAAAATIASTGRAGGAGASSTPYGYFAPPALAEAFGAEEATRREGVQHTPPASLSSESETTRGAALATDAVLEALYAGACRPPCQHDWRHATASIAECLAHRRLRLPCSVPCLA